MVMQVSHRMVVHFLLGGKESLVLRREAGEMVLGTLLFVDLVGLWLVVTAAVFVGAGPLLIACEEWGSYSRVSYSK